MSVDLEEQLRSAYDAVPPDVSNTAQLAARARLAGTRRKRLRATAGVGGGLAAATAIVTSVAVVGGAFGNGAAQPKRLTPAASSAAHPSPETAVPTSTPRSEDSSSSSPDPYQGHNKEVAGLAGYLLPHGAQLPGGLSYSRNRTASNMDGSDLSAAVVPGLVAARSNLQNDDAKDTTGQVASVIDTAFNYRPDGSLPADGSPSQRSVLSQIIEYKTVQQARSAVTSAQANRGGWVWFNPNGAVRVPWTGVPGGDGPNYLYKMAAGGLPVTYVAVQIVGKYALAATSDSPQRSSAAISSTMTNLKKANLL